MSAAGAGGGDEGDPRSDVDVVGSGRPAMAPLLEIAELNGYYGPSHVLQGVSFSMGDEPVAVIGRNGMGKSTLCTAITGSVRLEARIHALRGRGASGAPAYKIAAVEASATSPRAGACSPRSPWTSTSWSSAGRRQALEPHAIYEIFPRLAQRRGNGGSSSRAASSRCWRSPARCCSIRGC